MSTIIRTPVTDGQLTSGDPRGPWSCVAYATAYAVSHATKGRVHPTGRQIRTWTRDTSGGLELSQVDRAITGNTNLEPMTGVWSQEEFWDFSARGWHWVLLGGEFPIAISRFCAQQGFYENHGIYVPPQARDEDPLADGRPGAHHYKFHNEVYGRALTNAFAARLRTSGGHFAGPNHFEATGYRPEGLASGTVVTADFEVHVVPTETVRVYSINLGYKWVLEGRWASTKGFTAKCTGRQLFHLAKLVDGPHGPERHTDYSEPRYLVRLLSGAHGDEVLGTRKGWWINVEDPDITLRRI